jgi:hypothetical protein
MNDAHDNAAEDKARLDMIRDAQRAGASMAPKPKSKKERLAWLADEVGRLMGLTLEVRGSADAMLVVAVSESGIVSHPFGHVRRPASEIVTALRWVAMALARAEAMARHPELKTWIADKVFESAEVVR